MSDFDGEVKERTLFCGNLHPNVTEEILYELFLQAGPLEKVTLVKNKNYAFITFRHSVSVPYTIELMNGIRLYQRPLQLQTRTGTSNSSSPAQAPNVNLAFSPASAPPPPRFLNCSKLSQTHTATTSMPKVPSCSAVNPYYHRSVSHPNFNMNQTHYSESDGYEADLVHDGPGKTRPMPRHHNHRSMLPYGRTSTPDPRFDWNNRNSSFTHPAGPSLKPVHTNTMTMKSSLSWQTPQHASKYNF